MISLPPGIIILVGALALPLLPRSAQAIGALALPAISLAQLEIKTGFDVHGAVSGSTYFPFNMHMHLLSSNSDQSGLSPPPNKY